MTMRRASSPRLLHPIAWWIWGVGAATAASRTTNPVLLALVIAVVCWVVLERRDQSVPNPLPMFLWLGVMVVFFRVIMVVLLGNGIHGQTVLFELPRLPLPQWANMIRFGGPVTLESVLYAAYGGLQLAAILACLGAANAVASPKRLLRYLPATLYDVGTAVVVALTFAPQLVDDARRVRAARQLRGHDGRGLREMARLTVPVLEGALDQSLSLAASMESRGYGMVVNDSRRSRRIATALTLTGLVGVIAGLYGLLDGSAGGLLGLPLLGLGIALSVAALAVGARRDRRSTYRREPFSTPEIGVVLCAIVAAALMVIGSAQAWPGMVPIQVPASFPEMPPLATLAILILALPALMTPTPPRRPR